MKITITLPEELDAVLNELARRTGESAERIALRALLDRLEDFEDVEIAEERLRNPEGPPIPLEEVMRQFGLLDQEQSKPVAE